MNDPSLTISDNAAFELIVLVQDGRMTEATYMELRELPLSVKTINRWPYLVGLLSYLPSVKMLRRVSALSSTKKEESPIQKASTQHFHLGCSFNFLGTLGTNEITNNTFGE